MYMGGIRIIHLNIFTHDAVYHVVNANAYQTIITRSPNGSFLVMANLSESSTLEFYDADSNATLAKRCVSFT